MPPEIPAAFPLMLVVAILASLAMVGMIMAIPLYLIKTYHRRKMEELRLKQRSEIDVDTKAAIEALRKEMAALRDTTTQYDVSFDTALSRIESRVAHLERRINEPERETQVVRAGQ